MANTRLDMDKIYKLVMTCRQSGLSDKQWCIENAINPSTFYSWVKKLRNDACYDIPENNYHTGIKHAPASVMKQDVVKVDFSAEQSVLTTAPLDPVVSTPVIIQYHQANILIQDNFNPTTLKDVLKTLKEALC